MVTHRTNRLSLRPIVHGDFVAIGMMNSDPHVMRYLCLNSRIPTYSEAFEDASNMIEWGSQFGYGPWAITCLVSGTFYGWVGLFCVEGSRDIELGYRLAYPYWGNGYATEAGRKIVDYAFLDMNIQHLIALIHPRNHASVRVAVKVGMDFVKTASICGHALNQYARSRDSYMFLRGM